MSLIIGKPAYSIDLPECHITGEIFPLLDASLLWCGVDMDMLQEAKEHSEHKGKGVYSNVFIPCLEKKTRALYFAIKEEKLRTCREHGEGGERNDKGDVDYVAFERRYFWASDLKAYIEQYHPNDKPNFLFSKMEQKPIVDLTEYDRMTAEYTKQQTEIIKLKADLESARSLARDAESEKRATDDRLEKAIEYYRNQRQEIERLGEENKKLCSKQISTKTTNKQSEIIAALSVLFTKTDCTKPYEAAETILQEWQRHETELGKSPSKETLAQYILEGLNRIKP